QILLVHGGKLVFADNRRQRSRVAHLGVAGEKLVSHVLMILSGITFADAVLHQTGQRRKNAYRRIDRLAVKLSVKYDLSLGDISRKVGDGMGDIIVRHGQDGDLGDRSCSAPDDSRALIKSGELTVQISGISFTGGDFSFGGGNLTHGLAEGGDIRQDDQDVHAFFKSQILRGGKGDL